MSFSKPVSKTPCKHFALTGSCPYKDRCSFPHVKLCTNFAASGTCSYGDRCFFAHVRRESAGGSGSELVVLERTQNKALDAVRVSPAESVPRAMTTTTTTTVTTVKMMPKAPPPARKLVEVCLCFDTTGSMYPWLDRVRSVLKELIKDITEKTQEEGAQLRLGVIAHGDYCDKQSSYVIKFLPLLDASHHKELDKILSFVKEVGKTSGGDGPECYELAMFKAAHSMNWSDHASRVMVMIGDSTPHPVGYTCDGYINKIDWRWVLKDLAKQTVRIYAVQASHGIRAPRRIMMSGASKGDAITADEFWQTLAEETEGRRLEIADMRSLAEVITAAVCRELSDAAFDRLGRELSARGAMRDEVAYVYEQIRTVTTVRRGVSLAAEPAPRPSRLARG